MSQSCVFLGGLRHEMSKDKDLGAKKIVKS